MDSGTIRIACAVLGLALIALIVLRRRSRQAD